jgi:hypothetical protein
MAMFLNEESERVMELPEVGETAESYLVLSRPARWTGRQSRYELPKQMFTRL